MNRQFNFILAIAYGLLITSCTKVITPVLSNSSPEVVIQGVVSDTTGPYHIYITKSVSFYAVNNYPNITNAVVTISDSTTGTTDLLTQTHPGEYTSHTISGISGHTYLMQVLLDGKSYRARSVMPSRVVLDSVYFDFSKTNDIEPIITYQDPLSQVNYYLYSLTVNHLHIGSIQANQDQLFNGKYRHTTVDADTGIVHHHDLVSVSLVSVDRPVYLFLNEAQDIAYNNSNLAAPATPGSNITGGCEGYFSAQAVSTKLKIVP